LLDHIDVLSAAGNALLTLLSPACFIYAVAKCSFANSLLENQYSDVVSSV